MLAVSDRAGFSTRKRPGLSLSDLEAIVARFPQGTRLTPPGKVRAAWRVDHAGRSYKVRVYENSDVASRQEAFLAAAQHLFVTCHGRLDRHLVLDYLPGPAPARPDAAAI